MFLSVNRRCHDTRRKNKPYVKMLRIDDGASHSEQQLNTECLFENRGILKFT